MLTAVRPVRSLLLAIFMLMAGGGFMSTLVGVRLEAEGRSPLLIGAVATAYFAGLALGSLRVSRVIERVGHIRAFAAFVALLSASTLSYAVYENVALWGVLRFVDGLCVAGVYVCLESWLNDRAERETRGAVLAGYMVALYAGQSLGQLLLNLSDAKPSMPFVVASILITLAILPVALTRTASPPLGEHAPLAVRRLYAISPLGVVGAGLTGLMLGGFYGLGAVYVRRLGLDVAATSLFMSMVIAGGVALQWPLGRLSDRFDRRWVIVGALTGALMISLAIGIIAPTGVGLLVLGAVFGGLSFALYPLCVAHTHDHLAADHRVAASGGLVLVYSAGAAAGPLGAASAMAWLGPKGLFLFIASCALAGVGFALWRVWARSPVPHERQQAYLAFPQTTPMSATLDPLASGEGEG